MKFIGHKKRSYRAVMFLSLHKNQLKNGMRSRWIAIGWCLSRCPAFGSLSEDVDDVINWIDRCITQIDNSNISRFVFKYIQTSFFVQQIVNLKFWSKSETMTGEWPENSSGELQWKTYLVRINFKKWDFKSKLGMSFEFIETLKMFFEKRIKIWKPTSAEDRA